MLKEPDEIMDEIRESLEEKFNGWRMREAELKAKLIGVGYPIPLAEERETLTSLIQLFDEIIDYYDRMQKALGFGGETAEHNRQQKLELQQILAQLPKGE